MAAAVYLEHYLDSLESLPPELKRNFMLMRDLDKRAFDLQRDIDGDAAEYLRQVRAMPGDERDASLGRIQEMFAKSKEYSDDKVQLAMQTYEMVDKHIRRLDGDLARYEAEIRNKLNPTSKQQQTPQQSADSLQQKKGRKSLKPDKSSKKKRKNQADEDDDDDETPNTKKQLLPPVDALPVSAIPLASIAHPSDVLDMPVDPNEPTYCLCHQVSYGEMIGCDNLDCPIEWFHFACVGLTSKPKGKWFCPTCTEERKKQK